jgi:hypothetical protein
LEKVLRDKMDWVENKCYMRGVVQIGASFIWILAAMLVGMVIVWVLRRIPVIRKLI